MMKTKLENLRNKWNGVKNKKKVITIAVSCALIAAMGIGGTLAYLTDQTEATNKFTFGDVKVNIVEKTWDTTDGDDDGVPDIAENEVPNQQTPKSVQAHNVGINDAVVFIKVTVPVENVTRVFDDGTVEKKADGSHDKKPQEIFYFERETDTINAQNNNFDPNWINIPEEETGYVGAGGATPYLNFGTTMTDVASKFRAYNNTYRTYVFGYNKRIKPDEETTTLFDKVQIKNFLENEIEPGGFDTNIARTAIKDIKVESYSIQADNIVDANGQIDTTGTLGHDVLKEIYDIYVTQNPQYK